METWCGCSQSAWWAVFHAAARRTSLSSPAAAAIAADPAADAAADAADAADAAGAAAAVGAAGGDNTTGLASAPEVWLASLRLASAAARWSGVVVEPTTGMGGGVGGAAGLQLGRRLGLLLLVATCSALLLCSLHAVWRTHGPSSLLRVRTASMWCRDRPDDAHEDDGDDDDDNDDDVEDDDDDEDDDDSSDDSSPRRRVAHWRLAAPAVLVLAWFPGALPSVVLAPPDCDRVRLTTVVAAVLLGWAAAGHNNDELHSRRRRQKAL
jgi:hypothetical protein